MKRLYYLFRGTQHARSISDDLQKAGLDNGQLRFLSRDTGTLQTSNVHAASILQERDLQHSGFYGGMIGLGIGVLFALYLMTSELGQYMNILIFAFVCGVFAFFGTWTGGIVGISHDNHHIARFHDAIEHGDTLLMLDTYTPQQETKVREIMDTRHLEASFAGEDDQYREFI